MAMANIFQICIQTVMPSKSFLKHYTQLEPLKRPASSQFNQRFTFAVNFPVMFFFNRQLVTTCCAFGLGTYKNESKRLRRIRAILFYADHDWDGRLYKITTEPRYSPTARHTLSLLACLFSTPDCASHHYQSKSLFFPV